MKKILTLKYLLIASAFLLVIRFIGALPSFQKDFHSVEDYIIAKNIVDGKGYSLTPALGPTAIKVPVYPLFLALLLFIGKTKLFIVIIQLIISFTIPFLINTFVKELNSERNGIIVGYLYLLYPPYIFYPFVLEVTNLFVPLALLFSILLLRKYKSDINGAKDWIIIGIMAALLSLTQAVAFVVVSGLLLLILFKKKYKPVTISLVTMIICFSPWIIRNYLAFDKFIPLKSVVWMNVYEGYLPQYHMTGKYDIIDKKVKANIDSLKMKINDVNMEKYYRETAIKAISKDPLLYVHKSLTQAVNFWFITPRYYNMSIIFILFVFVPTITIFMLFLTGTRNFLKIDKKLTFTLLIILMYFTLIYSLTQASNIRFRLDIEWMLILIASFAFKTKNKDTILKTS